MSVSQNWFLVCGFKILVSIQRGAYSASVQWAFDPRRRAGAGWGEVECRGKRAPGNFVSIFFLSNYCTSQTCILLRPCLRCLYSVCKSPVLVEGRAQ